MKRPTAPLVAIGVLFLVGSIWLYSEARDDYSIDKRICEMATNCSASMSWTPTVIALVAGAVALLAALVVSKSAE